MKLSSEIIKPSKQLFTGYSAYAASSIKSFTEVRDENLLPEQSIHHIGRKTLVLDLDQTLVHARFENRNDCDFKLKVITL